MNKKLVIIGGGIVGITIAREAALKKIFSEIYIIEKEKTLGSHASSRNSGVIHAGFYYSPESFKAKFCVEGNKLMREYCLNKKINLKKCGKIVVTKNQLEEETLNKLYERGVKNGAELYLMDKCKINEYEPQARTFKNFLWSPKTWSTSPEKVFSSILKECIKLGIKIITDELIIDVNNSRLITLKGNSYSYDFVINSAGGYSLEVAKLFGLNTKYKILPFKGLYLKSKNKVENFLRHIYPVPNIKQPFLGIHTTLTENNYLKLGPTAIPVFSPDNYKLFEGLSWNISRDIISLQFDLFINNKFGFRDLALKEIKYLIKKNIINEANNLTKLNLHQINYEWYSPGIRPQLFNSKTNNLENDFVIENGEKSLHILNSISPAWTCALKTAKFVIKKVIDMM